jgi:hypothetical protein
MHLLICFALKEEAAPFRKIAAGKATSAQADISILLTGIGCQNAPSPRLRSENIRRSLTL